MLETGRSTPSPTRSTSMRDVTGRREPLRRRGRHGRRDRRQPAPFRAGGGGAGRGGGLGPDRRAGAWTSNATGGGRPDAGRGKRGVRRRRGRDGTRSSSMSRRARSRSTSPPASPTPHRVEVRSVDAMEDRPGGFADMRQTARRAADHRVHRERADRRRARRSGACHRTRPCRGSGGNRRWRPRGRASSPGFLLISTIAGAGLVLALTIIGIPLLFAALILAGLDGLRGLRDGGLHPGRWALGAVRQRDSDRHPAQGGPGAFRCAFVDGGHRADPLPRLAGRSGAWR
jgi:hypothetical protein